MAETLRLYECETCGMSTDHRLWHIPPMVWVAICVECSTQQKPTVEHIEATA